LRNISTIRNVVQAYRDEFVRNPAHLTFTLGSTYNGNWCSNW